MPKINRIISNVWTHSKPPTLIDNIQPMIIKPTNVSIVIYSKEKSDIMCINDEIINSSYKTTPTILNNKEYNKDPFKYSHGKD